MTNSEDQKKVPLKYMVLLFFALIFWSSAFVAIRSALDSYSPGAMALLRFIVASLVLLIFVFVYKLKLPAWKDLPAFLLGGIVGIFIYHVLLNYGEQSVTAATASFLVGTVPIFTAVFSVLMLKEYLKAREWVGIIISFLGIGIISFSEGEVGKISWGALMILLSATSASFYNIILKKLVKKYSPLEVTVYMIWMGSLALLIYLPDLIQEFPRASLKSTLEVVYLGIFPAALAYVIWAVGMSKFQKASHIASFLYFNPILTTILGIIWLKEIPGIYSLAGGLVVLAGVLLTNKKGK